MEGEFTFDRQAVANFLIDHHREQLESQVAGGLLTASEARLLAAQYSVSEALQRATDATLAMMREQIAERVH